MKDPLQLFGHRRRASNRNKPVHKRPSHQRLEKDPSACSYDASQSDLKKFDADLAAWGF